MCTFFKGKIISMLIFYVHVRQRKLKVIVSNLACTLARLIRRFCTQASKMKTAAVLLAEGAEEMETVISVDVLRRGGVWFFFCCRLFSNKKNKCHTCMKILYHILYCIDFFITEDECIYAPLLYHTFYDTEVLILSHRSLRIIVI